MTALELNFTNQTMLCPVIIQFVLRKIMCLCPSAFCVSSVIGYNFNLIGFLSFRFVNFDRTLLSWFYCFVTMPCVGLYEQKNKYYFPVELRFGIEM